MRFTLRDRDAVIAGDTIVTLDPYTTRRGPRIVAGAKADSRARRVRPETAPSLSHSGARARPR